MEPKKDTKDILKQAIRCDRDGRIFEAMDGFKTGVTAILRVVQDKFDPAEQHVCYKRVKDYTERINFLKAELQKQINNAKFILHIFIADDERGHSFRTLLSEYMSAGIKEMCIEEPDLYEQHHFDHLISLLELTVKRCKKIKFICIVTRPRDIAQQSYLNRLRNEIMKEHKINISINFEKATTEKKIILSPGFVIKSLCGIHIWKPNDYELRLGLSNFEFRNCHQNEIDVYQL